MLTGLWAVLALLSAGAGLAAVLSVQSSVGQTSVRPLSQEDVERAVATDDSGLSDIALDAVDGLASPVAKPSVSAEPAESATDDDGDLVAAQTDRTQDQSTSSDDATGDDSSSSSSRSSEPSDDSSTSSRPTSDDSTTTEPRATESESESESESKSEDSSGSGKGKSGSNSGDSSSNSHGSATPTAEPTN